jgi:DNA-binding NtrC family response regulator
MIPEKILLVEDEEVMAFLECTVLERAGFQLETVQTGGEALERLANKTYSALILDYRLPDMTAADILAVLGDRVRTLPVLVVTGYNDPKLARQLLDAGALEFIVKGDPGFLPRLPEVVGRILDSP